MNALIIALGALAVGKIHGQDTVASLIINSQVAAVSSNRRPVVYKEISQELQPPPPSQQASFQYRESSEVLDRSNLNTPLTTTRNYELRITAIAVTRQPIRMDLPSNKPDETRRTNTTNNAAATRNNNTKNEELKQVKPVRPEDEIARDNVSPKKPATTVIGPTPTTNLTFDERANFDGDQCPTGYVRVNGKCIEAD